MTHSERQVCDYHDSFLETSLVRRASDISDIASVSSP